MSKLAPDVRFRRVGDETVVLRQSNAEVLVVNEVAGRIVQCLRDGLEVDEIVEAVVTEFEVDPADCREDVLNYLAELDADGIMQAEGDGAPSPG